MTSCVHYVALENSQDLHVRFESIKGGAHLEKHVNQKDDDITKVSLPVASRWRKG